MTRNSKTRWLLHVLDREKKKTSNDNVKLKILITNCRKCWFYSACLLEFLYKFFLESSICRSTIFDCLRYYPWVQSIYFLVPHQISWLFIIAHALDNEGKEKIKLRCVSGNCRKFNFYLRLWKLVKIFYKSFICRSMIGEGTLRWASPCLGPSRFFF